MGAETENRGVPGMVSRKLGGLLPEAVAVPGFRLDPPPLGIVVEAVGILLFVNR